MNFIVDGFYDRLDNRGAGQSRQYVGVLSCACVGANAYLEGASPCHNAPGAQADPSSKPKMAPQMALLRVQRAPDICKVRKVG